MNIDKAITLIQQALVELGLPPLPIKTIALVKVGESIQHAIDTALDGTLIRIQPGVYPCNLVLPAGKTGIVLQTDMEDPVLTKPWVTPEMFGGKSAILVPQDPAPPIIQAAPGAHDYVLSLLEVGPNLVLPTNSGLVDLGDINQALLSAVPYNVHVDRCYIHGSDAKGAHRGLMLNTRTSNVSRNYISNCWERGRDSQAIAAFAGPGSYLISNNYLEGSGENFMIGGVDPKIIGLVPSDIVIQGNFCYKPAAWRTIGLTPEQIAAGQTAGANKNLGELKNARRVTIQNNVFQHSWIDAQSGHGVVFTVRDQDGTAPWATVSDVLCQYNVIRDVEGAAFNLLGLDDSPVRPSVQGRNLQIAHNLILDGNSGWQQSAGFQPTAIQHNTAVRLRTTAMFLYGVPIGNGMLLVRDNVMAGGLYGIFGDGMGSGTPGLAKFAPGAIVDHNVIEGAIGPYPSGNYLIPAGSLAALLDAGYHYTGGQLASDGTPIGADVDEIRRRIPWLTL